MTTAKKKAKRSSTGFGAALRGEQLRGLAVELQQIRHWPPLVRKEGGKYEGDILGFVKGLRLSARVAYFLREQLSDTNCDVSWGHLLDAQEDSCSPECDVIVHSKGHIRRWNGVEHPIMDFAFVEVAKAHAIISCKSQLKTIDPRYPKVLKRFGVKNIFLFAESCPADQLERLRKSAKTAGYKGVWCLYLTGGNGSFVQTDEGMYKDFVGALHKAMKC